MRDTIHNIAPPLVINHNAAMRNRHRARRVVILLGGILALGLGDLYATITHATSVGMIEMNPIGAYLINADSITGLILFKLGSMGIGLGLLLQVRHKLQGELSSWFVLSVMIALTLHWAQYNEAIARDFHAIHHARSGTTMTVELAAQ